MDRNVRSYFFGSRVPVSLSARRAWIEIVYNWLPYAKKFGSLSARRAWIEIKSRLCVKRFQASLSARRAWIEMTCRVDFFFCGCVALRKESVDRNTINKSSIRHRSVALRKESVDRNLLMYFIMYLLTASLSARRAWIEISFRFLWC